MAGTTVISTIGQEWNYPYNVTQGAHFDPSSLQGHMAPMSSSPEPSAPPEPSASPEPDLQPESVSESLEIGEAREVGEILEEFLRLARGYTCPQLINKRLGRRYLSSVAVAYLKDLFDGFVSETKNNKTPQYFIDMNAFDFKTGLSSHEKINAVWDAFRMLKVTDPELSQQFTQGGKESYFSRFSDVASRFLIRQAAAKESGLAKQISILSDQIEDLERRKKIVEHSEASLLGANYGLQSALERESAALARAQQEKQSLALALSKKMSEVERLQGAQVLLEAQVQDLCQSLSETRAALTLSQANEQRLQQQVQEQAAALEAERATSRALQESLTASQQRAAAAEDLALQREQENRALREELERFRREKDTVATVSAQQVRSGDEYAAQVRHTIHAAANDVEGVKHTLAGARAILETAQTSVTQVQLTTIQQKARTDQKHIVDVARACDFNFSCRVIIAQVTKALKAQEEIVRSSLVLWVFRWKRNAQLNPLLKLQRELATISTRLDRYENAEAFVNGMKATAQALKTFVDNAQQSLAASSIQKKMSKTLAALQTQMGPLVEYYKMGSQTANNVVHLMPFFHVIQNLLVSMQGANQELVSAQHQLLSGFVGKLEHLNTALNTAQTKQALLLGGARASLSADADQALVLS